MTTGVDAKGRAIRIIVVTDDGQHGSVSCGICAATIPDDSNDNYCPECKNELSPETRTEPGFGGSDF